MDLQFGKEILMDNLPKNLCVCMTKNLNKFSFTATIYVNDSPITMNSLKITDQEMITFSEGLFAKQNQNDLKSKTSCSRRILDHTHQIKHGISIWTW